MRLSPEQRSAIRQRIEAATPGPWIAQPRHVHGTLDDNEMAGLGFDIEGPPEPMLRGQFSRGPDAAFIAASRTDVPLLLDALEAAEAEVERLRAMLPRDTERGVTNETREVYPTDNRDKWDPSVCWHCGDDHGTEKVPTETYSVALPESLGVKIRLGALAHGRTIDQQLRMMIADYVALGRPV